MAVGVWSMSEDGSFELQEPYRTMLSECKAAATDAWRMAMIDYLVAHSPYTSDELDAELLRRVEVRNASSMEIVEEYILESLSGDLLSQAYTSQ